MRSGLGDRFDVDSWFIVVPHVVRKVAAAVDLLLLACVYLENVPGFAMILGAQCPDFGLRKLDCRGFELAASHLLLTRSSHVWTLALSCRELSQGSSFTAGIITIIVWITS